MRFVVAIPARNEAVRLRPCLAALARQRHARCDHVVLLLNNCTDGSAAAAERLRAELELPVTLVCRSYPPAHAHAGQARHEATLIAAELAGSRGIVATTDADAVVDPDWIANNLAALRRGADAVCGRAVIDPVEARLIHPELHRDDALEVAFGALLDEIHALADPDPHDPLPRHTEHSGASIAVSVDAFERAGGVPSLQGGEDRAFLAALRAVDARIRHDPDVLVTVSGRLNGRAVGGMAETIARRMIRQDPLLDEALEPADTALRRAQLRALSRHYHVHRDPAVLDRLEMMSLVPARIIRACLSGRFFGESWVRLEQASPLLLRKPVERVRLDLHREKALAILAQLRPSSRTAAAGQAGSRPDAALPAA